MATNFPSSPSNGATHTFGGTVYTYNSTKGVWKAAAGEAVTISDTPPSNPGVGDLWFDSSVAKTYIYYNDGSSNQWVQMNPSGGSDGADATGDGESPIIYTEPPTSHTLNSDGTTSTVQMQAVDPEGTAITYGIAYANSTNALPDQLGSATTIDQNTGTYTFTPTTTTSNAGTFKARLSASDGITSVKRFVDFSINFNALIDYLIVAGGGGGGKGSRGAGGGGGGMLYGTNVTLTAGTTYNIVVGDGGAGASSASSKGSNGGDSTFNGQTAIGGGGGGSRSSLAGASGGSGGGGASGNNGDNAGGGSGTAGQGNSGGAGSGSSSAYGAGGGGGAGASGSSGSGSSGGAGGIGLENSITGVATYYAGGGGGGARATTAAPGGTGGGGAGGSTTSAGGQTAKDLPVAGANNTGGGGGGSADGSNESAYNGAAGGSGIVIIRTTSTASTTTGSPTVTTDGSYNIYSFTADGSITF